MFANLKEAPPEALTLPETPEGSRKKQRPRIALTGFFSPVGLLPDKTPQAYLQLQGVQALDQPVLQQHISNYNLNGKEYSDPFSWKPYNRLSKPGGFPWQADLEKDGTPLKYCRGAGAMCKAFVNEVYAKQCFDEIMADKRFADKYIGTWLGSPPGYNSPKNELTAIVAGESFVLYGRAQYPFKYIFEEEYPSLKADSSARCTRRRRAPQHHAQRRRAPKCRAQFGCQTPHRLPPQPHRLP